MVLWIYARITLHKSIKPSKNTVELSLLNRSITYKGPYIVRLFIYEKIFKKLYKLLYTGGNAYFINLCFLVPGSNPLKIIIISYDN